MNSLQLETGGRPVANDDFQVLQDRDAVLGLPALLAGLEPCVVSGCRVWQTGSQWNVGAGLMWDGSQLLPFSGRSNVALPAMFTAGAVVVVDERAYQTGGTKTTIKEQSMDLVPMAAGAPNLVVDTFGALTFWHRTQEKIRTPFELQTIGTRGHVADHYDASGLGRPGTPAWGWALANGENDTDDMRQRVAAGHDPSNPDYRVGIYLGRNEVAITRQNLPVNEAGTRDVATFTGNTGAKNLVAQGANGWEGRQPLAGAGVALDIRNQYLALPYRQWVGY